MTGRLTFFIPIFILMLTSTALAQTNEISDTISIKEMIITATKTERNPLEIPARINIIDSVLLNQTAALQTDDLLRFIPGVNVNRNTGLYTQRPMVTLRGLSGDEQGRTLVLVNNVPVNTSDEGGVNWNRINQNDIERIEIFKGPGSSLYGNNAMGGVINIITKKAEKPSEAICSAGYGTYNTFRQDLNVRIRNPKGYYAVLSQFYQQSDGYNSVPDTNRTQYDIARSLEAMGISARTGFDNSRWLNWELQYDVFRDQRGEGYQIHTPEGCYRNFNTNLLRGMLRGGNKNTSYTFNTYYQLEHYYDVNEKLNGTGVYTRYDVNSKRTDMGMLANVNRILNQNNTLTAGFEYKSGGIQGGDCYQTAPYDTIYNEGNINTLACYLQDEQSFLKKKIRLLAGIRFDQVSFVNGLHENTNPWNTIPELRNNTWREVSPRAGLRFNFIKQLSAFVSYSHGFRASILDDLIRTGWMWVGPKYANPELKPETMENFEAGFDIFPAKNLKIALSAYYMQGNDFLYYVATSDSIYGRPIYRRENVTSVEIKGFEAEATYTLTKNILFSGSYTFSDSKIVGFTERPDLENKSLKYVPAHNASFSAFWQNKIINVSGRALYKSAQFADDENNITLDSYLTFDLMISRKINENLSLSLDIQDIMDNQQMEVNGYLSPGRLINGRITLKL